MKEDFLCGILIIYKGSPKLLLKIYKAMDTAKIEALLQKDLIAELGLSDAPQEEREAMLEDLGKTVLRGIWVRVMEHLSLEDQEALGVLMDTVQNPQELLDFLSSKIPNFDGIVKEEVAAFKAILLNE